MTTIEERSRLAVDELLDQFEEQYGEFERVEKTWELPEGQYHTFCERFENGSAGGAGVWLTNEDGEVLLVRNEGDDGWADPGGKVEGGETYETAAKRELREEAGVECRLTGLCEVHVLEHHCVGCDEPPLFAPIAIFYGTHTSGEPRPRDGEIAEVGWFNSPPETVLYEEVRTRPYPPDQD